MNSPALSYPKFVASRVKWMPTPQEDCHHAATGIMGEVVELLFATDRKNLLEELGDLAFYLEHFHAAWKKLTGREIEQSVLSESLSFADCQQNLIAMAGELLDFTKKLWIYNKPWEGMSSDVEMLVVEITSLCWEMSAFLGIADWEQVEKANQAKLTLRYPQGYSDAAAQARADKAEGQ